MSLYQDERQFRMLDQLIHGKDLQIRKSYQALYPIPKPPKVADHRAQKSNHPGTTETGSGESKSGNTDDYDRS